MRGYGYAPAQNMSAFTGTLVGRKYKPGQKYIQLVFKTAEGLRLSLTRDVRTVRELNVGQTYRIEGPEYVRGQKTFIYEPKARPIEAKVSLFKKKKVLILAAILLITLSIGSVLALTNHGSTTHTQNSNRGTTPESKQSSETSSASTAPAAQDQSTQPSTTPPPTPTSSVKKSTTTKSTKTNSVNPITNSQPASTPSSGGTTPVNDGSQSVDPSPPSPPPVDPTPLPPSPPADPGPTDPGDTTPTGP